MLLNLAMWLQSLNPEWGFLRVFQYLTFRAVMAAVSRRTRPKARVKRRPIVRLFMGRGAM